MMRKKTYKSFNPEDVFPEGLFDYKIFNIKKFLQKMKINLPEDLIDKIQYISFTKDINPKLFLCLIEYYTGILSMNGNVKLKHITHDPRFRSKNYLIELDKLGDYIYNIHYRKFKQIGVDNNQIILEPKNRETLIAYKLIPFVGITKTISSKFFNQNFGVYYLAAIWKKFWIEDFNKRR